MSVRAEAGGSRRGLRRIACTITKHIGCTEKKESAYCICPWRAASDVNNVDMPAVTRRTGLGQTRRASPVFGPRISVRFVGGLGLGTRVHRNQPGMGHRLR
jgi:hypothetical protein